MKQTRSSPLHPKCPSSAQQWRPEDRRLLLKRTHTPSLPRLLVWGDGCQGSTNQSSLLDHVFHYWAISWAFRLSDLLAPPCWTSRWWSVCRGRDLYVVLVSLANWSVTLSLTFDCSHVPIAFMSELLGGSRWLLYARGCGWFCLPFWAVSVSLVGRSCVSLWWIKFHVFVFQTILIFPPILRPFSFLFALISPPCVSLHRIALRESFTAYKATDLTTMLLFPPWG